MKLNKIIRIKTLLLTWQSQKANNNGLGFFFNNLPKWLTISPKFSI